MQYVITANHEVDTYSIISIVDIAGVIMYVSPIDHETYFPLGMREVAVVDFQ
jgi:hypothetical protein